MARYQLFDIANNSFDIAIPDIYIETEGMQSDIKIIEKTFRAGAVFAGIMRIKSKDIEFSYYEHSNSPTTFRSNVNQLSAWCQKTVLIKDTYLGIECEVVFDSYELKFDRNTNNYISGGAAQANFKFKRLNPFWKKSTATNYTIAGVVGGTSGTISITNGGYFDSEPIITLTAAELTTKILFHIPSTNEGMYIKDLQFGLSGLTEYVIDNSQGMATLGGYKRNNYIQQGTGFFQFPAGTFDLYYLVNGNAAINIDFYERNLV
jgi:hypothetical protein